jgi:hypothetical protein
MEKSGHSLKLAKLAECARDETRNGARVPDDDQYRLPVADHP